MLTPEYLEEIDWNKVVELYHQLNIDICSDIINRIIEDKGVISSTTRNQLQALMETGGSDIYENVLLKASELDTPTLERLKRLYENMAKKDLQGYKELYKYRDKSFKLSDSQLQILNVAILSSGQSLQNFTNTIAWASQQLYVDAIDQAYLDVVTGGLDYDTAIYNAVQDLASKGVTLQDSLGRNIALETAVRRNIRTGIKQTADTINRDIEKDLGCDGYETTAHLGARPTHEEWQGKQFACTRELAEEYHLDYWETSDAKAQLNDYNCRHTYFGIIVGISKPTYTKKELKEMNNAKVNVDGKEMSLYDAKTKLSRYKSTLRKYERERDTFKKALDKDKNNQRLKDLIESRNKLIDKWQARYEHLKRILDDYGVGSIKPGAYDKKTPILEALEKSGIKKLPVNKLKGYLSKNDIISGGDETNGSCSSVAFAYIANRIGLDVLDFRGGASADFFAKWYNIEKISRLKGVEKIIKEGYNDYNVVRDLLKNVKAGKEYYLATGQHASIIRKYNGEYQYLELQDIKDNGFKTLNDEVLRRRFGCQQSYSSYGLKVKSPSILIDISSFKNTEKYKEIMGYINTTEKMQQKGVEGYAK